MLHKEITLILLNLIWVHWKQKWYFLAWALWNPTHILIYNFITLSEILNFPHMCLICKRTIPKPRNSFLGSPAVFTSVCGRCVWDGDKVVVVGYLTPSQQTPPHAAMVPYLLARKLGAPWREWFGGTRSCALLGGGYGNQLSASHKAIVVISAAEALSGPVNHWGSNLRSTPALQSTSANRPIPTT